MKLFIFGANGMLGNTVVTYFNSIGYHTIPLTRKDLNIFDATKESIKNTLLKYNIESGDIIINCAGLIKQRASIKESQFIAVNSLFPNLLADLENEINFKLIHITTDCVFSGLKGKYTENDHKDIQDVYGLSKLLGENNTTTTIRTSIIGEEKQNKLSLLEWVRSNKGGKINGFKNHIWNGLTCLQLSKVLHQMIEKNIFWKGIKHIYSNSLNKYELVSIINNVYKLDIEITPMNASELIDRSLSSIHELTFEIPELKEQIIELKKFHETH